MLFSVEDRKEIAVAQRDLCATIGRDFPKKVKTKIGYPGGTVHGATVHHNEHFWFRGELWEEGGKRPRFQNWFGEYVPNRSLDIGMEANVVAAGRPGNIAGSFARDSDTGIVYLVHSGGIGGGTKGVGKLKFMAWLNENPLEITTPSGEVVFGNSVMPTTGDGATRSAIRYLRSVLEFKSAARRGDLETDDLESRERQLRAFFSEPRGRRRGRSRQFDYITRHGEIVDAVAEWRRRDGLSSGLRLAKNILIDLAVSNGSSEVVEVFEIKTTTDRQAIYCAIGQLQVHGGGAPCERKVLVLPSGEILPSDLARAVHTLNIEILRFRFRRDQIEII